MGDESDLSDTAVVVATDEQLATTIDGETVILQTESGMYYGFNEVASRVWELVQEPHTVADLCGTIESEYDVDAQTCRRDVRSVLREMADSELVAIDSESVAPE